MRYGCYIIYTNTKRDMVPILYKPNTKRGMVAILYKQNEIWLLLLKQNTIWLLYYINKMPDGCYIINKHEM